MPGLYRSERQAFDKYLETGYLDIWRYRNPKKFNIHGGIHKLKVVIEILDGE